jgi:hypothetical protein
MQDLVKENKLLIGISRVKDERILELEGEAEIREGTVTRMR